MNTFAKLSVCAMTFAGMFLASAETLDLSDKNFLRKTWERSLSEKSSFQQPE